jgi:hypothetical protein
VYHPHLFFSTPYTSPIYNYNLILIYTPSIAMPACHLPTCFTILNTAGAGKTNMNDTGTRMRITMNMERVMAGLINRK